MIALIRHTHTDYNIKGEQGRFCGSSNPCISNRGIQESNKIGNYFLNTNYTQIISSPLLRGIQTAQIVKSILNLPLIIENNFREIDYGIWEGLSKNEIQEKYNIEYRLFEKEPFFFTPQKGENPSNALYRFKNSFKDIKDNSIIITHKTVLRLFLCEIEGIELNKYREFIDLKLGSITLLSDITYPKVLDINMTNHLK